MPSWSWMSVFSFPTVQVLRTTNVIVLPVSVLTWTCIFGFGTTSMRIDVPSCAAAHHVNARHHQLHGLPPTATWYSPVGTSNGSITSVATHFPSTTIDTNAFFSLILTVQAQQLRKWFDVTSVGHTTVEMMKTGLKMSSMTSRCVSNDEPCHCEWIGSQWTLHFKKSHSSSSNTSRVSVSLTLTSKEII